LLMIKFYHFLHKLFELGYHKFQGISHFFNKIMELRKICNIQTEFIKVNSKGTVLCKYECSPCKIKISIEFSCLELDKCKEIIILNEQGSTFFRRYTDSSGLEFFDQKIQPWAKVKADKACFSDENQTLTFAIKNKSSNTLLRGWEKTKDRFSWAGLAYSLSPKKQTFCYQISLRTKEKR
jgi:hypothetical protein